MLDPPPDGNAVGSILNAAWNVLVPLVTVTASVATVLMANAAFRTVRLSSEQLAHVSRSQQAGGALEISKRWIDADMVESREKVKEVFMRRGRRPPTPEEIETLAHDRLDVLKDVAKLLNLLDIVAIGIRSGAYDSDMMYNLYGNIIVGYHEALAHVIAHQRASGAYPRVGWVLWKDLEQVAKAWDPLVKGDVPHDVLQRQGAVKAAIARLQETASASPGPLPEA